MTSQYDIAIVGAGVVGLSLACALSPKFRVVIIDHKEQNDSSGPIFTGRVSAINHSSQQLFESMGAWEGMLKEAAPYRHISVWDKVTGADIHFESGAVGQKTLGHIISNHVMQKALWGCLESSGHVDWLAPESPHAITIKDDAVFLTLTHQVIKASLVVGADGLTSWVRSSLNIPLKSKAYEHCGLVTTVETEKPHQKVAYQCFSEDDILAFLPLKHPNQSSIVWSMKPEKGQSLQALSEDDFNRLLAHTFEEKLGKIKKSFDRRLFPLMMRHAKRYVQDRVALIGDAIHTLHPLAGQGMNLGLSDAACLAHILNQDEKKKLGHYLQLRQYERARKSENVKAMLVVDGFKKLFCNRSMILSQARRFGLSMVNRQSAIKRWLIERALQV